MENVSENHEGNNANTLLAVVDCFQVNYMSKEIHKYTLVKWTDEYVKFKWKQNGRWHRGTVYHGSANEIWFKTEPEAKQFVESGYSEYFYNYR